LKNGRGVGKGGFGWQSLNFAGYKMDVIEKEAGLGWIGLGGGGWMWTEWTDGWAGMKEGQSRQTRKGEEEEEVGRGYERWNKIKI